MKITINIPDTLICGFLNGVRLGENGRLELVSYQLGSDDLTDGNTVKLPRDEDS